MQSKGGQSHHTSADINNIHAAWISSKVKTFASGFVTMVALLSLEEQFNWIGVTFNCEYDEENLKNSKEF